MTFECGNRLIVSEKLTLKKTLSHNNLFPMDPTGVSEFSSSQRYTSKYRSHVFVYQHAQVLSQYIFVRKFI